MISTAPSPQTKMALPTVARIVHTFERFAEEKRVALTLFKCAGGTIVLPDAKLVLVSREDGGNLIVNPPREVWERSELSAQELTAWSFLVAATGAAMLRALPQLENGCINYWEAGNWALNIDAEPRGVVKSGPQHRKVHLHLLGRSREAKSASLVWGEAPHFSSFAERHAWAANHKRLTPGECTQIVKLAESLLKEKYNMPASQIEPWAACSRCNYPVPTAARNQQGACPACAANHVA